MNEMMHDIEKWSNNKLATWFRDSAQRYMMADCSESDAVCATAATMMALLSTVIAAGAATPEEAGQKLCDVVRHIRNKQKMAADRKEER
jgi:hypothetical protein